MASQDLIKQAQQIADLGDRWFLGVARRLERIGVWARSEADVAADSARAALATTVVITRRLTRQQARAESETNSASDSRTSERRRRISEPNIDVLDANPVKSPRKRRERNAVSVAAKAERFNPPGLVPLLRALGRVVAVHAPDFAALENDERFWTLLSVLQSLRKDPAAFDSKTSTERRSNGDGETPQPKSSRPRSSRQP
jgi:hypothetical protein